MVGLIDIMDIIISAGILVSVTLLVATIFSRGGRVELSPQRAAAIAAGHSDRRTVFESSYLGSLMWLLASVAHRLAMPRTKAWVRRALVTGGNPNYYTPEEYLALALLTGLVLAACAEAFFLLAYGEFTFFFFAVALVLGAGLALYQLHDRASKRIRLISKRVPYALDLIALAMGAGATFTEAVQTVVKDNIDDPFNDELRTMLAEMDLGTTRRAALQNLADRVPLDTLRSIVASVAQAEQLGTPLAKVLHSQATLLRLQRSAHAENAAAVASVRILVPALFILMGVVLAVFAPAIVKAVRGGLL